ncbi:Glutamate receptor ionotropic like protein [Argiope bruennichi]|uniref:Glutamate receptor ionotropic like protein n=1 Tax=Argiope bruennichi TaxID=94029 RepID=A0A8T0DZY8_ARGBR|nr:Glutamate receptor ionotropic like protein [Argiope bruennichi]
MNSSQLITVAVLPIPNILDVENREEKRLNGYEGRFLHAILTGLGFQFDIVEAKDGQYGSLKADGNWTGMVGMVHRGEADLAFTTLAITEQRTEIIDFSPTYENVAPTFAYKKPGVTLPLFAYLYPFDIIVWGCIFLLLFLLPAFFVKISDKKIHYGTTFYKFFASLLGQSFKMTSKSSHLNALLCCWWIAITIIPASYSAAEKVFEGVGSDPCVGIWSSMKPKIYEILVLMLNCSCSSDNPNIKLSHCLGWSLDSNFLLANHEFFVSVCARLQYILYRIK